MGSDGAARRGAAAVDIAPLAIPEHIPHVDQLPCLQGVRRRHAVRAVWISRRYRNSGSPSDTPTRAKTGPLLDCARINATRDPTVESLRTTSNAPTSVRSEWLTRPHARNPRCAPPSPASSATSSSGSTSRSTATSRPTSASSSSRRRSDRAAAARVRDVRARLRRAADRQPRARRRRRSHRPARAADAVDRADGRRHARRSACCRRYAQIGVAAPVLLVLMRIIQGFSLGGEFTGSMVYTTELASPLMRGLVSSSTAAGTTLGFILGSGTRVARQPLARHRQASTPGAGASRSSAASCSCVAGWLLRRGIHESEQGLKAAQSAPPILRVAARRLETDRADVRHRRDDERGVLPDVHVRVERRKALPGSGDVSRRSSS